MKIIFAICFCSFIGSIAAEGQIISTFAGTGITGNSGDGGPATNAKIANPAGGKFDKWGNFYFTSGEIIRRISTSGIITTVAGGGGGGDGGPATAAELNAPGPVAVDTFGNLYITEQAVSSNRIRKVDMSTGLISTICGNGTLGYAGDGGPASDAILNYPLDICIDKNQNIYIDDAGNNRIRKIGVGDIITTIAGNGILGHSGDGGPATLASINSPQGICVDDNGDLYIADRFYVRKVSSLGIISEIAGNGGSGSSGDGGLAINAQLSSDKITIDKFQNIYVSDISFGRIRKITDNGYIYTVAGNGIAGYSGDGGPADAAEINTPYGVVTDTCGNLFIADAFNARVRKVTYPFCDYLNVRTTIKSSSLDLQPNPASDQLTISAGEQITEISITNLTGQMVHQQPCNTQKAEINIATLPPGLYLVAILDEDGNKTVKKLVKE